MVEPLTACVITARSPFRLEKTPTNRQDAKTQRNTKTSLPGDLRRAIKIDPQCRPAGTLSAQPRFEVDPVPVLPLRPADLGDRREPWKCHELDVADIAQGFRP